MYNIGPLTRLYCMDWIMASFPTGIHNWPYADKISTPLLCLHIIVDVSEKATERNLVFSTVIFLGRFWNLRERRKHDVRDAVKKPLSEILFSV
jgi:hypothetical protein